MNTNHQGKLAHLLFTTMEDMLLITQDTEIRQN